MTNLEYRRLDPRRCSLISGKVHTCKNCPYFSKCIFSILNHVQIHKLKVEQLGCGRGTVEKFSCRSCQFQTYLTIEFKQHIREFHFKEDSEEGKNASKTYKCGGCSFQTNSLLFCLKHQREGCLKRLEEKKLKILKNLEKVEQIKDTMEEEWLHCEFCRYKTQSKAYLQKHFMRVHQSVWYRCEECNFKSRQDANLRKHMLQKHLVEDSIKHKRRRINSPDRNFRGGKRIRLIDPLPKQVFCDKCDYKTEKRENLLKHINRMHMWYHCKDCHYKNRNKANLSRHIYGVHKWRECDQCDFKSRSLDFLRDHMRNHETGTNVSYFTCEKCGMSTRTELGLKQHISYKHGRV